MAVFVSAIMVMQCEDSNSITGVETSQHDDNDNIEFLAKEKTVSDFAGLKSQLKFIAKKLSKNKKWVEKTFIKQARKAGVPIDELKGLKINKKLKFDGLKYEIKVEMLNEGTADELLQNIKKPKFGLILDPDIFYTDTETIPVYMSDGSSSTIFLPPIDEEKEDHDVDSYLNAIGFPVFVVTIEEIEDPTETEKVRQDLIANSEAFQAFNKLGKRNGVPFVVLKEINLKEDNDRGAEEFEIYIGEGLNKIKRTTTHMFNGGTRRDYVGRWVNYPDINSKGRYVMSSDIALWPLTGPNIRFAAIEDDEKSGEHWRKGGPSPYVDAYFVTSNMINSHHWAVSTWTYRYKSYNPDDFLEESGVDYIGEVSMLDRLRGRPSFNTKEAINGALDDVDWELGLRYY